MHTEMFWHKINSKVVLSCIVYSVDNTGCTIHVSHETFAKVIVTGKMLYQYGIQFRALAVTHLNSSPPPLLAEDWNVIYHNICYLY
jgi:hypothetical protein